jgi:hypothetical protein
MAALSLSRKISMLSGVPGFTFSWSSLVAPKKINSSNGHTSVEGDLMIK